MVLSNNLIHTQAEALKFCASKTKRSGAFLR